MVMTIREQLPSVVSLAWALGALRWREGIGGCTYAGISELLGIDTTDGLRNIVRKAEDAGVVTVRYQKGRPVVSLTPDAVTMLEGALADG